MTSGLTTTAQCDSGRITHCSPRSANKGSRSHDKRHKPPSKCTNIARGNIKSRNVDSLISTSNSIGGAIEQKAALVKYKEVVKNSYDYPFKAFCTPSIPVNYPQSPAIARRQVVNNENENPQSKNICVVEITPSLWWKLVKIGDEFVDDRIPSENKRIIRKRSSDRARRVGVVSFSDTVSQISFMSQNDMLNQDVLDGGGEGESDIGSNENITNHLQLNNKKLKANSLIVPKINISSRKVSSNEALNEVRETANRLHLNTRRPSYVLWKEIYLDQKRRRDSTLTEINGCESNVDSITEEVLSTIRQDLDKLKVQDKDIARQLLHLWKDVNHIKLEKTYVKHHDLIEDLRDEIEALGQLCNYDFFDDDTTIGPNPLKQFGITKFNLSERRFSTC